MGIGWFQFRVVRHPSSPVYSLQNPTESPIVPSNTARSEGPKEFGTEAAVHDEARGQLMRMPISTPVWFRCSRTSDCLV